jgi:hypothetical protein
MKFFEIRQPSGRTLTEQFNSDNRTGFLTEDLVAIAQAHHNNSWSAPQTYEEFVTEDEVEYQKWLKDQDRKI